MILQIQSEELLQLVNDALKLRCLEGGGVDNWEWYGKSLNNFKEIKTLEDYGISFEMKYREGEPIYYNNTKCEFVTYLSKELAVIRVLVLPDFDIDPRNHCAGCMIGDSDNKLSCRCEDVQNILEDIEENTTNTTIPLTVEVSKLYEKPLIIQKHENSLKLINEEKEKQIKKTKEIIELRSKLEGEVSTLEQKKKDFSNLESLK